MKRSDAQLEARRKALVVARVFGTPDGEEALKILIKQFGGSCYQKGDPHHTAYLEGGRDVLIYIKEMMDMLKEKDDG
jgi:hypothetical protein